MSVHCLESHSLAIIKSSNHHFEFDYLKLKQISVNQYISSPSFSAGGYDWVLEFSSHDYGYGSDSEDSDQENNESHLLLHLKLVSEGKEVQAGFRFKIFHNVGKFVMFGHEMFDHPIWHTFTSRAGHCGHQGCSKYISKDKIETDYCTRGKLLISCDIRVLSATSGVDDSSGGLFKDIEKLWVSGERSDVVFEVEGERISAHRFMLAARSPVFAAELYGPMAEGNSSSIKINDMKAEVFKALLRFIYTDIYNYEHGELKVLSVELVQHLLVAADRYDLPMLKAQCEQRLWVVLSVDTVLTSLILAERHSSPWLKEKCLQFVSKSENFIKLACTDEYVYMTQYMMQCFPSLLHELRQKVNNIS